MTGGAGASIAPKAMLASSSLLKWLGIAGGAVVAAGAVGYVAHQSRLAETPASAPAVATAEPGPAARAATVARSPSPPARPAPATPAEEAPVPLPLARPAVPGARAAPAAPAGPASSLDEEVLAIDQARRSLTAGDTAAAIQQVDAYDARYPTGALAQESAEIGFEALFRSGKRAQAEKLAARFLAAHPSSPYARVIRALEASPAAPAP